MPPNVETFRHTPTRSSQQNMLVLPMQEAHSYYMDTDDDLSVRVARNGRNYLWELHRDGVAQKVKYSGPIYFTEESAMAAGCQARALYVARLKKGPKRS